MSIVAEYLLLTKTKLFDKINVRFLFSVRLMNGEID